MKHLFFSLLLLVAAMTAAAQTAIDLWPYGAPHKGAEGDSAIAYVYLPAASRATGRAVVILPGGGYSKLTVGQKHKEWAQYFNQQGIAAIVLKYRLPHGDYRVPIEDAEEALALVRRNAETWHINGSNVGIMGVSAGGHLASVIATHAKKETAPNFQILLYPVITMDPAFTHKPSHDEFLGSSPSKKKEREYSSDQQVTRATPRAFIALSDDDHSVLPANGVNYYLECYRHDVPASLHVYPTGGHGWGLSTSFAHAIELQLDLKAWLQSF